MTAEGQGRASDGQSSGTPSDRPGERVPVTRAGDKSGAILILSIVLAILLVVMSVGFCIIRRSVDLLTVIGHFDLITFDLMTGVAN